MTGKLPEDGMPNPNDWLQDCSENITGGFLWGGGAQIFVGIT